MCSFRNALSAVWLPYSAQQCFELRLRSFALFASFSAFWIVPSVFFFVICAIYAVRCALLDVHKFAHCNLCWCTSWFWFLLFSKDKRLWKKQTYRGLGDTDAKTSPKKKLAVTPVWALFGCSSRTTAWWRGRGYMDFAFLHGCCQQKLRQQSSVTRPDWQCDSTPL